MTNLNQPGTIEYAVRHAMDHLGAKRVARILGCGADVLYKGTNPNYPDRRLPSITMDQAQVLAGMLKRQRRVGRGRPPPRTEHFSDVLRAAGDACLPSDEDIHRCFTRAAAAVGAFAETIYRVSHPTSPGGALITKAEFSDLSRTGRAALALIADVLSIGEAAAYPNKQELQALRLAEMDSEIASSR